MLHDNMNISRIMVYTQQVEETRAKRKSRDSKRESSFDGGFSKNRLDIQDKPRFKKRSSNKFFTKFRKVRDYRVSKPKSQKERGTAHQTRSQLMESVARSIMVIASLGRTISFGVSRVSIG